MFICLLFSFEPHVDMLCSKLSKSMYCINRVKKHFIDAVSLKKLYYSTIHSNISYGINVYSSANSTTLEKLRKKTKAAIRINCNANYRAHSMSLPHCPFISEQNILLIPHSLDLLEWLKRTEDDVICKS